MPKSDRGVSLAVALFAGPPVIFSALGAWGYASVYVFGMAAWVGSLSSVLAVYGGAEGAYYRGSFADSAEIPRVTLVYAGIRKSALGLAALDVVAFALGFHRMPQLELAGVLAQFAVGGWAGMDLLHRAGLKDATRREER